MIIIGSVVSAAFGGVFTYLIARTMWLKERRTIEKAESDRARSRYCWLLHHILIDMEALLDVQLDACLHIYPGGDNISAVPEPLATEAVGELFKLTDITPNFKLLQDITAFYRSINQVKFYANDWIAQGGITRTGSGNVIETHTRLRPLILHSIKFDESLEIIKGIEDEIHRYGYPSLLQSITRSDIYQILEERYQKPEFCNKRLQNPSFCKEICLSAKEKSA